MSATVVYNDVDDVDDVNGECRGTLFGGVKFYVHQRVPSRNQLLGDIKVNGGKIVQLEKFADVKIGDHARKDAPPGFVSWKYIADSIQCANLCNIDDYKIGGNAPRPVGGPQPQRSTRSRFTADEDKRITQWIVREIDLRRRSMAEIYQKAAEEFPTHTWQSIENRWKKKLRLEWEKQQEKQPLSENDGRVSAVVNAPSPSPSPSPQPVRRGRASVVSPISDESRQQSPKVAVKKRTRFTQEDDTILRNWVKGREGEGLRGNKIYKELEEQHPHHSYQSWRDRWIRLSLNPQTSKDSDPDPRDFKPASRTLNPQKADENARRGHQAHETFRTVTTTVESTSRIAAPRVSMETVVARRAAQQIRPHSNTTLTPVSSAADPGRSFFSGSSNFLAQTREREAKLRRVKAARKIQRTWRSYHTRLLVCRCLDDITRLLPLAKGALVRRRLGELRAEVKPEPNSSEPDLSDPDLGETDDPAQGFRFMPLSKVPTPKEQFYIDIQTFYEAAKIKQVPWVEVGRKSIELWDLWDAVTSQGETRDWEEIADSLGIDLMENPKASGQLKGVFEKHLGEFEDMVRSFEAEPVDDGDDITASEPGSPGSEQFPSSPPIASLKRSFGAAMLSSSFGISSPSKRRRFELHQEIPYTPDKQSVDRTPGLRDNLLSTPIGIRLKSLHSSPQQLPAPSIAAMEPETQDFQFGEGAEESRSSPSHHLRSGIERESVLSALPTNETLRRDKAPLPADVNSESDSDEYFGPPPRAAPHGDQTTARNSVQNMPRQTLPGKQLAARRAVSSTTNQASAHEPASTMSLPNLLNRNQHRAQRPQTRPRRPLNTGQSLRESFSPAPSQNTRTNPSVPLPRNLGKESSAVERFESLGYTRPIVEKALRATTGDIGLAGQLMEANKTGIPNDVAGVWTQDDDNNLRKICEVDFGKEHRGTEIERLKCKWAKDAKEKLESKHGVERCDARRVYLQELEKAAAAERAKRKRVDWRAALRDS
ncbi:TRF2-interacting telomeric protein/Rap1 C terminal domain-containing protein [Podospora aff. communis PSN243]|uniref:DNA-binding protein RAP1 n=1 Tax=Podospora aff. communis PSN243 TaxID=3040156 RepID=A0AAV9G999_9PEZI|nr:TRF2-interacting telomeric protein/Rap1 C terminal domain-containing protein [Podospora aff. communis PSN243]